VAITMSLDKVKEKGAKIAAHLLEAAEEDLEFAEGSWTVKGTDRSVGFGDVALTAYVPHNYPEGLEPGLEFTSFYDPANFTFPYGAHIAVVEVDTETGHTTVERIVAVDDAGIIINPLLAAGQIHGGLAQGIAQALLEEIRYDEDGNPQTSNLADYTAISMMEVPTYERSFTETSTPHNPLGAKGIGEAGSIGSTAAVQSAVVDALTPFGIRHLDMPLTPERIWSALQTSNA